MITTNVNGPNGVLNSWKEIAVYLDRGVRTVQRWEADLNLPVHRPRGRGRSAVLAIRSELDQWVKESPVVRPGDPLGMRPLSPLILESRQLRMNARRLRGEVHLTLENVIDTVNRIARQSVLPPEDKLRGGGSHFHSCFN